MSSREVEFLILLCHLCKVAFDVRLSYLIRTVIGVRTQLHKQSLYFLQFWWSAKRMSKVNLKLKIEKNLGNHTFPINYFL